MIIILTFGISQMEIKREYGTLFDNEINELVSAFQSGDKEMIRHALEDTFQVNFLLAPEIIVTTAEEWQSSYYNILKSLQKLSLDDAFVRNGIFQFALTHLNEGELEMVKYAAIDVKAKSKGFVDQTDWLDSRVALAELFVKFMRNAPEFQKDEYMYKNGGAFTGQYNPKTYCLNEDATEHYTKYFRMFNKKDLNSLAEELERLLDEISDES